MSKDFWNHLWDSLFIKVVNLEDLLSMSENYINMIILTSVHFDIMIHGNRSNVFWTMCMISWILTTFPSILIFWHFFQMLWWGIHDRWLSKVVILEYEADRSSDAWDAHYGEHFRIQSTSVSPYLATSLIIWKWCNMNSEQLISCCFRILIRCNIIFWILRSHDCKMKYRWRVIKRHLEFKIYTKNQTSRIHRKWGQGRMNTLAKKIRKRILEITLPFDTKTFSWDCITPENLRHLHIYQLDEAGNRNLIYFVNAFARITSFHELVEA